VTTRNTRHPAGRNLRLAETRRVLHDLVCQSADCGTGDHARRTQHRRAVRIVDTATTRAEVAGEVVDMAYPYLAGNPSTAAERDHVVQVMLRNGVAVRELCDYLGLPPTP
jgi:hypothetical protein